MPHKHRECQEALSLRALYKSWLQADFVPFEDEDSSSSSSDDSFNSIIV